MNRTLRQSLAPFAIIWTISALLLGARIDQGWVTHDEGIIGHSAERVLAGELPHRDFDDVYTGGLAYLNAGGMRVFGVSLRSPRLLLIAVFLLTLPVFYYAATRFVSPLTAAGATLLAVVWSLPNYLAAMPSWYNAIFAILMIAALMRFIETSRPPWLFAAGLCGGLSFLMKLVGLYSIAAGLLFLVFREQEITPRDPVGGRDLEATPPPGSLGYQLFVAIGLAAFIALLTIMLSGASDADFYLNFLVPAAALSVAVVVNDHRQPRTRATSLERLVALGRLVLPFALGAVLPIALYVIPYLAADATSDLFRGLFVTPRRRLTDSVVAPLSLISWVPAIAIAAAFVLAQRLGRTTSLVAATAIVVAGLAAVFVAGRWSLAYRSLFYSAVRLAPLGIVAASVIVGGVGRWTTIQRQRVMVVAAATAMFGLVQFPYAAPIYFCYVAPLVVLVVLAVMSSLQLPSPAVPAALAVTLIAFAVTRMHPSYVYDLGHAYTPVTPLSRIEIPRAGGLRIPVESAREYERLVALVRQHAGGEGAYLYAAPDLPELYFLSGLKNPTHTLYDLFDDPRDRPARVMAALREHDVRVITINERPDVSKPLDRELRAALEREYTNAAAFGQFHVRWRE